MHPCIWFELYLPNIHLEICVTKAKSILQIVTKTYTNSSFVVLKCFHTKIFRIRNTIISRKQRSIICITQDLTNESKILRCSLMGPIKNLHVKTGVLIIERAIIALEFCAISLFFIDLFQSNTSRNKYYYTFILAVGVFVHFFFNSCIYGLEFLIFGGPCLDRQA